jgi:hypothetical protein
MNHSVCRAPRDGQAPLFPPVCQAYRLHPLGSWRSRLLATSGTASPRSVRACRSEYSLLESPASEGE